MPEEHSEPTIEIDSDWKAEAQREKQKLIDQEKKAGAGGEKKTDPVFVELLNVLAMQAYAGLGGYEGPDGQVMPPDLEVARHGIAMFEALQRKTEGNLSDEERRGLGDLIHRLRMQYVSIAQAVGAAGPAPGGPAGPGAPKAR